VLELDFSKRKAKFFDFNNPSPLHLSIDRIVRFLSIEMFCLSYLCEFLLHFTSKYLPSCHRLVIVLELTGFAVLSVQVVIMKLSSFIIIQDYHHLVTLTWKPCLLWPRDISSLPVSPKSPKLEVRKWTNMASAHNSKSSLCVNLHHLTINIRGGIVAGLDQDVSVSFNRPARPV
jgi:hypothetical protein